MHLSLILGLALSLGTPDPCTSNLDAPECVDALASDDVTEVSQIPYARDAAIAFSAESLFAAATAGVPVSGRSPLNRKADPEERPVTISYSSHSGSTRHLIGYMSYPDETPVHFKWLVGRDGAYPSVLERDVHRNDFMDHFYVTCECPGQEIAVRLIAEDGSYWQNYGYGWYEFTCP